MMLHNDDSLSCIRIVQLIFTFNQQFLELEDSKTVYNLESIKIKAMINIMATNKIL